MKRFFKAIWNLIKRILGIKDKEDKIIPTPTPNPTPIITEPVRYWYILEPQFIDFEHIDSQKVKEKKYYSGSYYKSSVFKKGKLVLDKYNRMFSINGYVTSRPTDGEILGELKNF